MEKKIYDLGIVRERKQLNDLIEKAEKIPEQYAGDIRRFREYAAETGQEESFDTLLNYLARSLEVDQVKKTTWERRLSAVKKYLVVTYGQALTDEQKQVLSGLRRVYQLEEYKEQTHIRGQQAADKEEIMQQIGKMDVRAKAICLVNLVTANRPSEMVRLKVGDFDLIGRSVRVYMAKQKEWHIKRLTPEAVEAVRAYIRTYKLQQDHYFVGRVRKGGHNYESVQIGEVAYNKFIHRHLHFAPYTLRKTQVSAMHEKGADLPAIAKQTGHKSLEVLSKHYLKVNDKTIDKFL